MWNASGYVGYRYNKLKYSIEPVVIQDWETISYNECLCPSKGDKSVYRTTDTVTIHIYDSDYDEVVLAKSASMVSSNSNNGLIQQYYGLQPGIYDVFLQGKEGRTSTVSFEVVEAIVSYELDDDGENIKINFESSPQPEYAAICDIHGNTRNYPISDLDRRRGYIVVPRSSNPNLCYYKVIFKGEYGRISSLPVKVD